MSRIRLVHGEPEELRRREREVEVDGDPAAKRAEVVAEREPRLVTDDLHLDALAGRQIEQVARPRARLRDDGGDSALDAPGRDVGRSFPALETFGQRPVTGEELLELCVRRCEDPLGRVGRAHAVAALHLVGVRARLACQHADVSTQRDDLVA